MKYIAHLNQGDAGCDYTIGCGHEVVDIEADSMMDATIKLIALVQDEYNCPERELASATIYEVSNVSLVNIGAVNTKIAHDQAAHDQARVDEKEAGEYARLKAKFENA